MLWRRSPRLLLHMLVYLLQGRAQCAPVGCASAGVWASGEAGFYRSRRPAECRCCAIGSDCRWRPRAVTGGGSARFGTPGRCARSTACKGNCRAGRLEHFETPW